MVQKVSALSSRLGFATTGKLPVNTAGDGYLFSSPEHEVLKVSYCDR